MKMPQDFVDAINEAVKAVNPSSNKRMIGGPITLGHKFDEWVGPEALLKYGLGPMPPEAIAAFEAKFAEKRDELKSALVASAVRTEELRMAGKLTSHSFNDSQKPHNGSDSEARDA